MDPCNRSGPISQHTNVSWRDNETCVNLLPKSFTLLRDLLAVSISGRRKMPRDYSLLLYIKIPRTLWNVSVGIHILRVKEKSLN